jgi:pullulanase
MTFTISGAVSLNSTTVAVKDALGNPVSGTISGVTFNAPSANFQNNGPYSVSYTSTLGVDTVTANPSVTLMDTWYDASAVTGLGLTFSGSSASFKVWAPLASKVETLVYSGINSLTTPVSTVAMTVDATGVWSGTATATAGEYYQYAITNNGTTKNVCDIYAKAVSPGSVAAEIVNIDTDSNAVPSSWEASYVNPFGTNGTVAKKYGDAVVFEMHIRDWSRAFVSTSTGKFADITAALNNPSGAFYTYLKDLGVTHVQILPMFDYTDPSVADSYNWGYNPYLYTVPENRYVDYTADPNGTAAVLQVRQMVKAFHDAGIAVNMDVVYNHTNGTGDGSLFDMTVPKYYYRFTTDGSYSNGSGCGNETASNTKMFKKYMIDTLKLWMNEYHFNGFRFDLMGLHETSTMSDIYTALSAIDPNVMVYGEPWTGGTSTVVGGVTKATIDSCATPTAVTGVACFNDDFRNAIKGAEYPSFASGQVQGTFADSAIDRGLLGSLKSYGGFTSVVGRSINYVEAHDNNTLIDKLERSMNSTVWKAFTSFTSAQQTQLKNEDKLSAAFTLLAQGTPFLDGGQEFMRTKLGDENSYQSPDSINQIDLGFKATYADVYNTYTGLITLRQNSGGAFTGDPAPSSVTATTVVSGLTKYVAGNYCVYFNATGSVQTIDSTGYTKVVAVDSGALVESTTLPTSVPATGFVILKQ